MQDLIADWESIKDNLKEEFGISDTAFKTFIKPLEIKKISDENVFILIPFDQENSIGIDYYNKRYVEMLRVAIDEYTGREYEVVFVIRKKTDEETGEINNTDPSKGRIYPDLKSEYTFENFVVGKNNEFAHSAAVAVAENPGQDYNPLFLYGGPGVGKTHLMHAIGHYILSNDPSLSVLYVTSEQFTNDLIKSLKTGSQAMDAFRKKYRNLDVLLLDDIQFIQNKDSTQEEFFHTFNELHSANKAIIISSDKPPKELKTLEERLKSRFDMGMIADIKPPDYETRAAILRQNFEKYNLDISDDVIDYIASNIKSNIRELTGATNKLKLISLNNELTLDIVKRNISDFINESNEHKLTMDDIIN
nr:chromosomal replication initiator protein DnaA [Lachnospiraceae bacterium]